MAVPNAFCKIDGIKGDSQIEGFEDQIEVIKLSHEVKQPVSVSAAGRGSLTVSDTKHSEFQIVKEMDIASPGLLLHASNGKTIPKIEVTLCRQAGDSRVSYMKYELENCVISTYKPSTDVTGDGLPEELVGITYGKITATYTATDTTGKEKGSTACEVDLSKGKTG
jgi:type VI secretion system Hcp family effector